jgi:hypothetical protein
VSTTALVWFLVGLLTLTVALVILISLIRHVIKLGRAAGRFRSEVGPIGQEISELGGRASSRPRRTGPDRSSNGR